MEDQTPKKATQVPMQLYSDPSLEIAHQTRTCFRLADICVSFLIVFPLVIGFWRGVWNLSDFYSKEWSLDPWLSISVGNGIPLVLYLFQEPLRKYVRPDKMNFVLFYCVSRTLLLVHSFGSVNQWLGLWELVDQQFGITWESAGISLVLGVTCSIGLKTFCNVLAPPLFLAVDDARSIHDCPLRFQTTVKTKFSYIWDCFLSVFVVACLTVLSWRGLWELADLYIFPQDPVLSAAVSLIVGYGIVFILFLTQPLQLTYMKKLKGFSRLVVADSITFYGFIGCCLAWRGLWNLYDEFLGTPNMSDWATLTIGAVGSLLLGSVSTIITRGVAIDGEIGTDVNAAWPIPYVSLLREPQKDTPFSEPWIFRYLCTTQKFGRNHGQGVKVSDSAPTSSSGSKSQRRHVLENDAESESFLKERDIEMAVLQKASLSTRAEILCDPSTSPKRGGVNGT